jgi:hypothetical protein
VVILSNNHQMRFKQQPTIKVSVFPLEHSHNSVKRLSRLKEPLLISDFVHLARQIYSGVLADDKISICADWLIAYPIDALDSKHYSELQ